MGAAEVPVGVGGDTLTLQTVDAYEHGPGILVIGPPRSGRSTTLLTMAGSLLSRGWQLAVISPRRSVLRDFLGTEGVAGVFGADADSNEVAAVLDGLKTPHAVVIDDLELLGQDTPLAELIEARVAVLRDTGNLVLAAGTSGDLTSMYRGPAVAMKKSRSGIVLSPEKYDDAELFGLNLPQGLPAGNPPGRALHITNGQYRRIQVARLDR